MNKRLSYFLFFAVRYIRGEFLNKPLGEIRNFQKLKSEKIEELQVKKINLLLKSSISKSQYFRKFNEKFNIEKIRDLEKYPVLEKDTIRKSPEILRTGLKKRISKRSTSGSTGIPLTLVKDRNATAYMDAVMYGLYRWHGIQFGAPQARFWGVPLNKKAKIREQVKDFLMNRVRMSAFELSNTDLSSFYSKIKKFKPEYFYGYPSLIYHFACFLENNQFDINSIAPRAIIITGEKPVDFQIKKIEEVFNANVYSEYGCTELGVLAFECPDKSLHVASPNIVLEVLENDSQVYDREGDIVVTELNSYEMPLFRYRIGDRGVLLKDKCKCGLEWPVVKVVEGRKDDYILRSDGIRVYDAFFAYLFKKGVSQFKVIQKDKNNIIVKIVRDASYSDLLEKKYKNSIHNKLGDGMTVIFEYVKEIDREKNGKFKYFESLIGQD